MDILPYGAAQDIAQSQTLSDCLFDTCRSESNQADGFQCIITLIKAAKSTGTVILALMASENEMRAL
jgi:hypothetical protein